MLIGKQNVFLIERQYFFILPLTVFLQALFGYADANNIRFYWNTVSHKGSLYVIRVHSFRVNVMIAGKLHTF